ncbi:hypothetical protein PAXRUDRAFT_827819 [Paxillus rubicundulus Ve08.2h10]|uniref:Unplaced genomic scaffold scaffold_273, whole genome shotgun sequence n=1 Tax=Paxillus rubicundulus Ve08.2h10 TaxID=930991 RepID=A0A0D0DQF6_9AGAM|nr:hypothetical protein PAXRUDRAFT_827819 [Paxillus rubicundulus Ve08.2h10]
MGNSHSSIYAMQVPSPFINADIVDRILTALPDFATLTSTILTCKAVYTIYRAHPASIQREVAYNFVGAALPEAIRYVRCKAANMILLPPNQLLGKDEFTKNPALTKGEICHLISLSKYAKEVEDVFSWREKDYRSQSTRLSALESYRFHRALHVLSLYSSTYGQDAYLHDEYIDDVEDDEDPRLDERKLQALDLREKFFDTFSTLELREIQRVNDFLEEIITWSMHAQHGDFQWHSNYLTFCGPPAEVVLQLYTTNIIHQHIYRIPWVTMGVLGHEFVMHTLQAVLQKRKAPRVTYDQMKLIVLDEICGGEANCMQCQAGPMPRGQLWSPSTWDFFRGTWPSSLMHSQLKGNLPGNIAVMSYLRFNDPWTNSSYSDLISQVFEYKKDEYALWARDDPLCTGCMKKILREHIHLWFVGEKRKGGDIVPEDCWYGYNCRTQTHNATHAAKLNHFCEPTRGDPA